MDVHFFWSGPDPDLAVEVAVASAALRTPSARVAVVTDLPRDDAVARRLAALPNVELVPLRPDRLLGGALRRVYDRARFVQHRSDVVRFALLAEHGGVYLDTDTVTLRPLDVLAPEALFHDGKIVHTGVLAVPPGHPAVLDVLGVLAGISDADLAVYQSIVHHWTRAVMARHAEVVLADLDLAFPVHWTEWERLFRPGEPDLPGERAVVLHHYGWFSRERTRAMTPRWLEENDCAFSRAALPVARAVRGAAPDRVPSPTTTRRT
jgi:hypothetical protein